MYLRMQTFAKGRYTAEFDPSETSVLRGRRLLGQSN